MRRNTLNFIIDAAIFLMLLGLIFTGLLIRFVLPPGSGGRHGGEAITVWSGSRHDWGDIHFWIAAVMVGLAEDPVLR